MLLLKLYRFNIFKNLQFCYLLILIILLYLETLYTFFYQHKFIKNKQLFSINSCMVINNVQILTVYDALIFYR